MIMKKIIFSSVLLLSFIESFAAAELTEERKKELSILLSEDNKVGNMFRAVIKQKKDEKRLENVFESESDDSQDEKDPSSLNTFCDASDRKSTTSRQSRGCCCCSRLLSSSVWLFSSFGLMKSNDEQQQKKEQ